MFGGVGLGTFPLASPFTAVDHDTAIEVLDAYFDGGWLYLDTAPTYAFGAVESLLGEYLAGRPRDEFAISTSCGYVRDGDAFRISGRRDDVRRDMEESLARLRLDFVDVYISHIPDLETPLDETAGALQELLDDGMARRIGVSNVDAAQLAQYAAGGNITVVQNRLSYLNRAIDDSLIQECSRLGADIVAYQVIERGLLTDRGPVALREGDLRQRKPEFEAQRVQRVRRFVETRLRPLAATVGLPLETLAVRWALGHPGVGLVQQGATTRSQVDALPLRTIALDPSLREQMDNAYADFETELRREGHTSVRAFLGLTDYDVRSGSASGS